MHHSVSNFRDFSGAVCWVMKVTVAESYSGMIRNTHFAPTLWIKVSNWKFIPNLIPGEDERERCMCVLINDVLNGLLNVEGWREDMDLLSCPLSVFYANTVPPSEQLLVPCISKTWTIFLCVPLQLAVYHNVHISLSCFLVLLLLSGWTVLHDHWLLCSTQNVWEILRSSCSGM